MFPNEPMANFEHPTALDAFQGQGGSVIAFKKGFPITM
jgi:hypothetical protein